MAPPMRVNHRFLTPIATISAGVGVAVAALAGCSMDSGGVGGSDGSGRIESRLSPGGYELVDTSPSGRSGTPSTGSTRVAGGLSVQLPRAKPTTERLTEGAPCDLTSAAGAQTPERPSTTRFTEADVPYAGPKPMRLADSTGGARSGTGSGGTASEPFPKSQHQQAQEAKQPEPLAPAARMPLLSERSGADQGPDLVSESQRQAPTAIATAGGASGSSRRGIDSTPSPARGVWGVVLATFSGEGNRPMADGVAAQFRQQYPTLPDIHVRSKPSGSVVLAGRFEKASDPGAKELLAMVKAMEVDGKRVFPRAMLTAMTGVVDGEYIPPQDLRQLRLQYPDANPLYSLQVAVWSTFDSSELSVEDVRRRAEAYCLELRARGLPAYFSHSETLKTSAVTVGSFGVDAYDSRSTLYSDEVEALLREFPKHLVNGEELLVSVSQRNPTKMVPQKPYLVEVPR